MPKVELHAQELPAQGVFRNVGPDHRLSSGSRSWPSATRAATALRPGTTAQQTRSQGPVLEAGAKQTPLVMNHEFCDDAPWSHP